MRCDKGGCIVCRHVTVVCALMCSDAIDHAWWHVSYVFICMLYVQTPKLLSSLTRTYDYIIPLSSDVVAACPRPKSKIIPMKFEVRA